MARNAWKLRSLALAGAVLPAMAFAQIPDLLTALDAGGRGMGMGGGVNYTSADTTAAFYNPAGLGHMDSPRMGLVFRNLPGSSTTVSGNFADPVKDTRSERGANSISHVGVAFPLGRGERQGPKPVVALTYTLGGYINDRQTGDGLSSGNLTVRNYENSLRLRSDYFTLAYSQARPDHSFSWGVGLNYVRQGITRDVRGSLVDNTNNFVGSLDSDISETGNGLGATVGFQMSPNPNFSFGASYRTEVKLSGNSGTAPIYDRIPARLAGGFTIRRDGFRGGRDFVLLGGEVQHFFRGRDGVEFDRGPQTTFGAGVEYNMFRNNARIPIRLGYAFAPRSSDDFLSRNAFTAGVGYEPDGSNYGVDLNVAFPERGGFDVGISFRYKIGR